MGAEGHCRGVTAGLGAVGRKGPNCWACRLPEPLERLQLLDKYG